MGTSTSKEAKEYFSDMVRHKIKFKYDSQNDDDSILMAFSKKAVDQRKDVDVTAALHEEELDGDLEALDLVEYAQVARIKYDLDNNKSNKKLKR